MPSESVKAKLATLPAGPGVYVFRGVADQVLYVGKARSLRSRVRSYFQAGTSDERAFIARLEGELEDIETFVVATEKEAALLENQLIKERQPRYNVKLRDDKEYLSLRLDPAQEWGRLEVVRRPALDGALYFGPYHSATAARKTLRLVNRHFQLRTCTDTDFKSRKRPCLQYQIRRCPAPCVYEVDRETYGEQVNNVALFLDGRHDELIEHLEQRMHEAASAQSYELAAIHRDQLHAVSRVRESQRVATVNRLNQDVMGLFRQGDQAEIAVLQIRTGKIVDVRTFALHDVALPDSELMSSFVAEYYASGTFVPDEILLSIAIEAMEGWGELLSEERRRKCRVLAPKRGDKVDLVKMAQENAGHAFHEKQREKENVEERLQQIAERLRLRNLPRRIECIDVSHTQGEDTAAAIVTLTNGVPDRGRYKVFHVKSAENDDYQAMYEVLSRRFVRGSRTEKGWELPDLLLVDGGRGQLGIAEAALAALGIRDVALAGLAKERTSPIGEELVDRIYLPNQKNPIVIRSTPALQLLALARDEAHRVSNALRRKAGKRRQLKSRLDDIEGIGTKTRARLLRALGSFDAVVAASDEALRAAGLNRAQLTALRRSFPSKPDNDGEPAIRPTDAEEIAIENAFVGEAPDEMR